MAKKQKIILITGVIIIALMCLVPPWKYTFSYEHTFSERPAGYFVIFTPPLPKGTSSTHGVVLDIHRLMIQWFVAIGFIGAAWLFCKD